MCYNKQFLKIHTLILCLMICIPYSAKADEVKVLGFYQQPTDLTASVTQRRDLNGKICALIKVILTKPHATFEGNVIGDVEFKTNEYWVYVSQGTKSLRIKVPDTQPLTVWFENYGIEQATAKTTYELMLLVEAQHSAPQMQKLHIQYVPPHAKILIDGYELEGNDGSISALLPVGVHKCQLSNDTITKEQNFTLFASAPQEILWDLYTGTFASASQKTSEDQYAEAKDKPLTVSYETVITEKEIYGAALQKLKEYNDVEAEQMARKGIALGYMICYEIIEALLIRGYYDEDLTTRKQISKEIENWRIDYKNKKETIRAPRFAFISKFKIYHESYN